MKHAQYYWTGIPDEWATIANLNFAMQHDYYTNSSRHASFIKGVPSFLAPHVRAVYLHRNITFTVNRIIIHFH